MTTSRRLTPLLTACLVAAGTAGCGSEDPAGSPASPVRDVVQAARDSVVRIDEAVDTWATIREYSGHASLHSRIIRDAVTD
ncbi:MAG: hypothetical protein H0V81_13825 [Solirubrobacterales bacterium]|nr:hypothetical protein [Solirubrobacterales bacterium]